MVNFCAPTYNHSTGSHTCKFFPFQSAVKAKDKYKRWIPPIRVVTVFIENLSFWKQRKIQQFWADALFSSTRDLAEIYDRRMRAVACGVYSWFMIAFVLCIMVFFFFIFITLYCEPELSLNRTVTVTAYICFHHAWAEILEAVNSLCRRRDKGSGKHFRVCGCHFRDGKKSNGSEVFERNKDK